MHRAVHRFTDAALPSLQRGGQQALHALPPVQYQVFKAARDRGHSCLCRPASSGNSSIQIPKSHEFGARPWSVAEPNHHGGRNTPLHGDCSGPLHPKREAARGFNQASLLAQAVSKRMHVPVLTDGIVRTVDTPPQVGLSREQRLRNVAGAFSACRGAFGHGGVLLVDDVATTGATLIACARQLAQEGGAPWVWGAVLARGS